MTTPSTVSPARIRWEEWTPDPFTRAQRQGRLVLLYLCTTWCYACRETESRVLADERVAALVDKAFVPVRVDADRRPDIAARYAADAYPTFAVLDTDGDLFDAQVLTDIEPMLRFLRRHSRPTALPSRPPRLPVPRRPGKMESSDEQVETLLRQRYDRRFAGLGTEPKHPPVDALEFLLLRSWLARPLQAQPLLQMVEKTLEQVRCHLLDELDGGCFRCSEARDWKVPHYEKRLDLNSMLLRLLLEAQQALGRDEFGSAAVNIRDYLLGTLFDTDSGAFWGSQASDPAYYLSSWTRRARTLAPPIDRTVYTGWNALAASALLAAYVRLNDDACLDAARRCLIFLWEHVQDRTGLLCHYYDGLPHRTVLLDDQVAALSALLDAFEATQETIYLSHAQKLARALRRLMEDRQEGGFWDLPEPDEPMGRLRWRQKPVRENAVAAEALIRLHYLTGDDDYLEAARRTLEAVRIAVPGLCYLDAAPFVSRLMQQREEQMFAPAASAFARAWTRLVTAPIEFLVSGPPGDRRTDRLVLAALKAYAPHRVVRLVHPERDLERVWAFGGPSPEEPAVYLCQAQRCVARITAPEQVEPALAQLGLA